MYTPAPGALVIVAATVIRGTIRATPRSAILATNAEFRRTFLYSRQVAVDNGRRSLVEVDKAASHVFQYGALETEWQKLLFTS